METLAFESHDIEHIEEKLSPLFNTLFQKNLQAKDEETITLLARYLARIITKSSQQDLTALSFSLQQVIAPAISQEIASNKDAMVDTLYPIMGSMISKYVTQAIKGMMQQINHKIEEGLSFERYKRKIKAKVTGVSETELLLEATHHAQLFALFIIDKESSLLVSEAHLEDKEIDDPHMVASMASAIKDFINDWVQSDVGSQKVQILSYANATLYIEEAGSVYMIAFLDSEPEYEMRDKLNHFFASLLKKYATFFQHFEGDDSAKEIEELSKAMHKYLTKEHEKHVLIAPKEEKKRSGLYVGLLLGGVVLGWVGYSLFSYYQTYRLEAEVAAKTGVMVTLSHEKEHLVVEGEVESFEEARKVMSLLGTSTLEPLRNHLHLPLEKLEAYETKSYQALQKEWEANQKDIQKRLQQLQDSQRVEAKKREALLEELAEKSKEITLLKAKKREEKRLVALRPYIEKRLTKAFINNTYFNPEDASLTLYHKAFFQAGKSMANPELLKQFSPYLKRYLALLLNDQRITPYLKAICVEGYTDSSGNSAKNQSLSLERAKVISQYLLQLDNAYLEKLAPLLQVKGLGSVQPIVRNGVEDKEASRRIKIHFILDQEKIRKKLGNL